MKTETKTIKIVLINFMLLFLFAIIFSGCSKKNYEVIDNGKTKIFSNKNKPQNKNLKIVLNKEFEIFGATMKDSVKFNFPSVLQLYKDNYYLLDYKLASVFKFDSKGKLQTVFGRKGQGPGEMVDPNAMVISNDTVYVIDTGNRRIAKFTVNGNFITNKNITDKHFPQYIRKLENGDLLSLSYESNMKEDGQYFISNVEILNPNFKVSKVIKKFEKKASWKNWNYLDIVTYYATNGKEIFIAKNCEEEYSIEVFNLKGEKIYRIKKSYRKKKIDKKEYKLLNDFETKHHRPASKITFKKTINGMFCGENGYLFVAAAIDRNESNKTSFIVDVFKDGVFINTITIPNLVGYDFNNPDYKVYIKKNKIFIINRNNFSISSYNYKIVE